MTEQIDTTLRQLLEGVRAIDHAFEEDKTTHPDGRIKLGKDAQAILLGMGTLIDTLDSLRWLAVFGFEKAEDIEPSDPHEGESDD